MVGDSMMQMILAGINSNYLDVDISSKTYMRLHVGKIISYVENFLKNLTPNRRVVVIISSFHDMLYRTSATYLYDTCFKYTCLRWVKDRNRNEFTNAMEQQGRQFEELISCLMNTISRLRVENQVSVMVVIPPPMDLFKAFRMQPLPSECLDPQSLESSRSPYHDIANILVEDMQQSHAFLKRFHERAELIEKDNSAHKSCKALHAISYFVKYLDCLEQNPELGHITLASISDETRDYHALGITSEDGTMPNATLFPYLRKNWDNFFNSILNSIEPVIPVKSPRLSLRHLSRPVSPDLASRLSSDLPRSPISSVLPLVVSCDCVPMLNVPCLTTTVQFREIPNLLNNVHNLIPSGDMVAEVWRCVVVTVKPYYVIFKVDSWDYTCLDLPGLYFHPDVIPRHNHQLLMPAVRYLGSELETILNVVKSMPQSFEKYMALVMIYARTSFFVLILNHKKGSQALTYPDQFSKMCDRCHLLEALREVEDFMYAEYVYIFHTLSGSDTTNPAYFGLLKSVISQKFLRHATYIYDLCKSFRGPPRLLNPPTSRAEVLAARRSPSPTRFKPRSDSPYSVDDMAESLQAIPVPGNRHFVGPLLPPHAFESPETDSYKESEFQDLKDEVRRLTTLMMNKFKE